MFRDPSQLHQDSQGRVSSFTLGMFLVSWTVLADEKCRLWGQAAGLGTALKKSSSRLTKFDDGKFNKSKSVSPQKEQKSLVCSTPLEDYPVVFNYLQTFKSMEHGQQITASCRWTGYHRMNVFSRHKVSSRPQEDVQ
ncbi:hypothetical protein OS493_021682 [Desmophyllum pertusum]|uniref:Uncharacterized protein n=1 Tax=Desmophyllum pertusum TaxID=174260 RepID=A0A9W9YEH3_9CNID|nr:hypothetical protein OS493_021682 [Desmophyllum pertusum]